MPGSPPTGVMAGLLVVFTLITGAALLVGTARCLTGTRVEWATPLKFGFGVLFPLGVFLSLAMSVVAVGPWLTSPRRS